LTILTLGNGRPLNLEKNATYSKSKLARILLLSLHTRSKLLRLCTLAVNTVLIVFAADFALSPAYRPAKELIFARIGAVQPDSVKVQIRYPQDNATEGFISVKYRPATHDGREGEMWQNGPSIQVHEDNDWVGSATLPSLWPNTTYEYILTNSTSHALSYPPSPLRFKTFPDHRLQTGSFFRFVTSSCLKHNFPYFPGAGDRIEGLELLSDQLWPGPAKGVQKTSLPTTTSSAEGLGEATNSIQESYGERAPLAIPEDLPETAPTEFLLLLGDFIYADVPYYFGDDAEAYSRMYRRTYASPSFRKIFEKLPVYHIYDDHEVINNFAGASSEAAPYVNASRAFHLYNAEGNYNTTMSDEYYYTYRYGDTAFFVMDTRRHRSDPATTEANARTMLGDKQLSALHSWISEVNETAVFKFIVTSVPFTSLWQHDAQTDSWAGYPDEKAHLLELFHSVPNVILLSGDRHEFAAVEYNGPYEWSHQVLEFSTSPLSMFDVPFIRTLTMESTDFVEKVRVSDLEGPNGTLITVTDIDLVPSERVLEYKPNGNYKWSTFEVDTRNPEHPVLHLELTIGGKHAYHLSINGSQVSLRRSTALGVLIPQSMQGILDKIGFAPSRWF